MTDKRSSYFKSIDGHYNAKNDYLPAFEVGLAKHFNA